MSMWRRFVRRGTPVLALILALGILPLHSTGAGDWDLAGRFWSWFVGVWAADGERGPELDPNGTTGDENRGPELDPDGMTPDEDRGPELDPNG